MKIVNKESGKIYMSLQVGATKENPRWVETEKFLQQLKDKKYVSEELTVQDFLKIECNGLTNLRAIIDGMPYEEKFDPEFNTVNPNKIWVNTTVYIPVERVTAEMLIVSNSSVFVKNGGQDWQNSTYYVSERQREIESSVEYVPFEEYGKSNTDVFVNVKSLNIKVWLYSRALDSIYDISQWVLRCTTTKNKEMGAFTITLPPFNDTITNNLDAGFVNQYSVLTKDKQKKIVFNLDWLTKNIQYNDIVFIRFEKLKIEGQKDVSSTMNSVAKSELNDDVYWDMIGLIDSVQSNVNFENTEYSISLIGRDLMKLFSEDGTYFLPEFFTMGDPKQWYYGGDINNVWFKRNVISGNYDYFFTYDFQTIANYSSFIINQLSSIGITEDDLFAYVSGRSEFYPIAGTNSYLEEFPVRGIWKIIKLYVDKTLEWRTLVDTALQSPEGTLLSLFQKICQEPFVEFYGDTWGSLFELIARQPPFTKNAITEVVTGGLYITIENKHVISMDLSFDSRNYGWYRITPYNSWNYDSTTLSYTMLPIIYLDEYVYRFGNHGFNVPDIYFDSKKLVGIDELDNYASMRVALIKDLMYAVETNVYLPFTRTGTIVIDGDRRIRVGTFVLLDGTDELFYVKAVENNIAFDGGAVDRVTKITVERGMKKAHYQKYFEIVPVKEIQNNLEKEAKNETSGGDNTYSRVTVNKEIFNFFLERRMMNEEG